MTQKGLCESLLVGAAAGIDPHHLQAYVNRFQESLGAEIKVIMADASPIGGTTSMNGADSREDAPVLVRGNGSVPSQRKLFQLTDRADLFVVIGATLEVLDKAARGLADDVLLASVQSYQRTVVFVPVIDPALWDCPSVRRDRQLLAEVGHELVPPEGVMSMAENLWDGGPAPSPDTVVRHLMHVRMKELRREYWAEATRERPLTPAQRRLRTLAVSSSMRQADGDLNPGTTILDPSLV